MKLSIIVAVYNTSKYLVQCLDSVLNQTMDDSEYEVIIVNDKSTDNSLEIINSCISGHSNVRVIDKEINEATFWSRVDGIAAAKGDYIGFVDSDDWCELDMYENMVNKAIESGADIVECGTIYEYPDNIPRHEYVRSEVMTTGAGMIYEYSQHPIQLALYLRLFKKSVMDKFMSDYYPYFNGQREKYRGIRNEDDLLLPLFFANADKFLSVKEFYCHHRMEIPGSTMDEIRNNPKKFLDSWIYRVDAGFDVLMFTKDKPEVYKNLEHKQINVIFGLMGKLLESDFYSKEEAGKILKDAVKRFVKIKSGMPVKDELRFLHLRLKTFYLYGRSDR